MDCTKRQCNVCKCISEFYKKSHQYRYKLDCHPCEYGCGLIIINRSMHCVIVLNCVETNYCYTKIAQVRKHQITQYALVFDHSLDPI